MKIDILIIHQIDSSCVINLVLTFITVARLLYLMALNLEFFHAFFQLVIVTISTSDSNEAFTKIAKIIFYYLWTISLWVN